MVSVPNATYRLDSFDGYTVVLPHVQNVYGPEEDFSSGWTFGFKYQSGQFEFFHCRTKEHAQTEHDRLVEALERFYGPEVQYEVVEKGGS